MALSEIAKFPFVILLSACLFDVRVALLFVVELASMRDKINYETNSLCSS